MLRRSLISGCFMILAAGPATLGVGADGPKYVKATITVLRTVPGYIQSDVKSVKISDPEEMVRLESYFPGLGEFRKSEARWKWIALVQIDFADQEGKENEVLLAQKHWHEGHGDWELNKGFQEYLAGLLKKEEQKRQKK